MTLSSFDWGRARKIAGAATIVAGLLASGTVKADSAGDLVLVLHYDDYYASIAKIAVSLALQRLKDNGMAAPALADASAKLKKKAEEYQDIFLKQMAGAYRGQFSAQELSDLITFYKSPLGKKVGGAQKLIQDRLASSTRDAGVYLGVAAAQLAGGAPPSAPSAVGAPVKAPPGGVATTLPSPATPASAGSASKGFRLYDNRDVIGNAFSTISASDAPGCMNACTANSTCIAFTENVWNQKCFLKDSVSAMLIEPVAVSGIRKDHGTPELLASAPFIQRYRSRIFPGDGYRALPNVAFADCENACTGDNACVAYTFLKQSGLCKLFKKVDPYHNDSSADSGVKRQKAP
jgi:Uncharacterized protein conserved in bacteria (DUF2059)/PAN domain